MLHVNLKEKALDVAVHFIVFATIYGLLLSYFSPEYLFLKTITTGGDTPSHYAAANYLIHTLLPRGKIIGWMPGNYAGFPLFQSYFPLPFLIMGLLQIFMPIEIAFKLVTVLGIFLLPLCTYAGLRLLRQQSPVPLIGATFSLAFLFMESNSMWGGNIPSTLSGEFAYSLGFAMLVLYIGSFYRGVTENRYMGVNALILTGIGISHGYALLFAVFVSSFFLFTTQGFFKKLWYYLRVNSLAFLLLGFWLIQFLWFIPYTTPFNFVWVMDGISQVFPGILLPLIALAIIGTILVLFAKIEKKKTGQKEAYIFSYLWFTIFVAGAFYFIAYEINLVDIRFLPYVQFTIILLGALSVGLLTQRMKARQLIPILMVCLVVFWVNIHVTYIPRWIKWDYSGFETKGLWPQFHAVNNYLKGSYQDPRVAYEHDLRHRAAGSVRAFESLPLFSGRSTLEGLYIQSTITSPFIFYLQSETSLRPSCPLSAYNYSRLNFRRGLEHLKMFNVSHFIAVTNEVRKAIEKYPDVVREKDFPPYTVYRLRKNPGRYVSLLNYEPPLIITKNWRKIAFEWFRRGDLKIHIAFKDKLEPSDAKLFNTIVYDQLPENSRLISVNSMNSRPPRLSESDGGQATKPTSQIGSTIKEIIRPEEIIIETPYIGRPHLLKISYHPNWHVEGADKIYLVSPCFMLIYPTQEKVRLYFGRSFPNYIGWAFSLVGLLTLLACIKPLRNLGAIHHLSSIIRGFIFRLSQTSPVEGLTHFRYKKHLLWGVSLGIIGILLFTILMVHQNEPTQLYNRGMDCFKKRDYEKARTFFEKGMSAFPLSPIIDQTVFHFAITYFKERKWQKALDAFEEMAKDYPESRKLSEVLYHMGLCNIRLGRKEKAIRVFQTLINEFPEDKWAGYARERLKDLGNCVSRN